MIQSKSVKRLSILGGDCDTYCPEYGGPFIEKPRFFSSEESYKKHHEYDGFYFPTHSSMTGRIHRKEYFLTHMPKKEQYLWCDSEMEILLDAENRFLSGRVLNGLVAEAKIDMRPFYIMRTLFDGMANAPENYASIMSRGRV